MDREGIVEDDVGLKHALKGVREIPLDQFPLNVAFRRNPPIIF